ncbi:MAG TPA: alpha/beta hydrolase [Aggregatilineales bacterium]|nr:alpha/beta hydrolase [Aggregatilineales bacterium]
MPLLTTDPPSRGIIHYEVYGKGRPVLFLHGWLGSWQLWRETIERVGERYRTYSLDFWGFGESRGVGSEEEAIQDFSVNAFVDMVGQFMDKLGIPKAAIIGHSMGGTVAMSSAIRYPDRIVKAVTVGAPINGESLYLLLKLGGNPTLASLGFLIPPALRTIIGTYTYFAAKDGAAVRSMVLQDLSRTTMQSFFQSIGTLRRTNLTGELPQIQQPLMGFYGKRDIIVSHRQHKLMKQLVPHANIKLYNDSGHFPMIDCPEIFIQDLLEFLDSR